MNTAELNNSTEDRFTAYNQRVSTYIRGIREDIDAIANDSTLSVLQKREEISRVWCFDLIKHLKRRDEHYKGKIFTLEKIEARWEEIADEVKSDIADLKKGDRQHYTAWFGRGQMTLRAWDDWTVRGATFGDWVQCDADGNVIDPDAVPVEGAPVEELSVEELSVEPVRVEDAPKVWNFGDHFDAEYVADVESRIARIEKAVKGFDGEMREQRQSIVRTALEGAMYLGLRCLLVHSINHDGTCTCDYGREKTYFEKHGVALPADDLSRCSKNRGKHPRSTKWNDVAYSNPDAIERMFTEKPKGGFTNIGFAYAEQDRIAVVDFDGPDAEEDRQRMIAMGWLPKTATVVSGSGGKHAFVRIPAGVHIKNSQKAIPGFAKVDIRGVGGFSVAPGSRHKSGGVYRWLDGFGPRDVPIADAPIELLHAMYFATKEHHVAPDGTPAREGTAGYVARGSVRSVQTAKVAARKTSTSSNSTGSGWRAKLRTLGDGEGMQGFHGPINSTACAYFGERGVEAAATELKDALIGRMIEHGPRESGDYESYMQDAYLDERIEEARKYIAENPRQKKDFRNGHTVTADDYLPGGFVNKGNLLCKVIIDDDGNEDHLPIASAITPLGKMRDQNGRGWCILLGFKNKADEDVEVTLNSADILSDPGKVTAQLAGDHGMWIDPTNKLKALFFTCLGNINPPNLITTATHPGIHNGHFITPLGEVIGPEPQTMRLKDKAGAVDTEKRGTLDGWRDAVEASCSIPQNWHWPLGVMAGFAGVVIGLCERDTVGFNYIGATSTGKSTAQGLQVSSWANPKDGKGLLQSMKSTANAMPVLVAKGSHTTFAFDELGLLQDVASLSSSVFGLFSASDRAGLNADNTLRERRERGGTFLTLSGELSIPQMIASQRQDFREGIYARVQDLSTDGAVTVDAETMERISAFKQNYGHAGPEFVRFLSANGYTEDHDAIDREITATAWQIAGQGAESKLIRAGYNFALVQWCGMRAQEAGLLPETLDVADVVMRAWRNFTEGSGVMLTQRDSGAADNLRKNLASAWNVSVVDVGTVDTNPANKDDPKTFRDREGYYDASTIYIPADKVAKFAGVAKPPASIIAGLIAENPAWVLTQTDRRVHKHIPKVSSQIKHYRFPRAEFGPDVVSAMDGVAKQAEEDIKALRQKIGYLEGKFSNQQLEAWDQLDKAEIQRAAAEKVSSKYTADMRGLRRLDEEDVQAKLQAYAEGAVRLERKCAELLTDLGGEGVRQTINEWRGAKDALEQAMDTLRYSHGPY